MLGEGGGVWWRDPKCELFHAFRGGGGGGLVERS